MAKNLFIWLLIILLLISSGLLGLELLGRDEYRPSLKFGADKSQDTIEIKQKLQNIEEKLDKLEKTQSTAKVSSDAVTGALNSIGSSIGTIQNGTSSTDSNNTSSSNGATSTGLQSSRPSSFDLDQEILTYLESAAATSGGKLTNTQNEVFVFSAADSALFGTNTVKVGDKFKVSAKVTNNAGVYTFQTITKVEKVV